MKKYFSFYFLVLSLVCTLAASPNNVFAGEYKSVYGNYSLVIPDQIKILNEGPMSFRFCQQNIMVSLDTFNIPLQLQNIKPRNFNGIQINVLDNFLISNVAGQNYQKVSNTWQNFKNKDMLYLVMENKSGDNLDREIALMKVVFFNNQKLFVISAFTSKAQVENTIKILEKMIDTLKVGEPKTFKTNFFKNDISGYTVNIPNDWETIATNAENTIQLKPKTSTINENGSIRTFETNEFAQFANATGLEVTNLEKQFIDRVTKYANGVTVKSHQPINANGINGILMEETINNQNDTTNLIFCYLFTATKGYQIKYATTETTSYEQFKKSFIDIIDSFKNSVN